MYKTQQEWSEISTRLQLGELRKEALPLLLFKCIKDLSDNCSKVSEIEDEMNRFVSSFSEIIGDNNLHTN